MRHKPQTARCKTLLASLVDALNKGVLSVAGTCEGASNISYAN
jgi:hypothetical protein